MFEIFICLDLCTDNSTFLTDDHSLTVYTSMITFIEIITSVCWVVIIYDYVTAWF